MRVHEPPTRDGGGRFVWPWLVLGTSRMAATAAPTSADPSSQLLYPLEASPHPPRKRFNGLWLSRTNAALGAAGATCATSSAGPMTRHRGGNGIQAITKATTIIAGSIAVNIHM